jgi:hypothetical protein
MKNAWIIRSWLTVCVWCSLAAPAAAIPAFVDGGALECEVDADCNNPYLACVAMDGLACERDAAAALLDGGACTPTIPKTVKLCSPTYQRDCHTDQDCGPAGFTCNPDGYTVCGANGCQTHGQCEAENRPCDRDPECPEGWSCYSPRSGLVTGAGNPFGDAGGPSAGSKACYPPFAVFHGGPFINAAEHDTDAGRPARDSQGPNDSGAASTTAARRDEPSSGGCALVAPARHAASTWLFAWLLGVVAARRARRRAWSRPPPRRCP